MWAVILRVALYVAIVTTPVILSALLKPGDLDPFPVELATRFALIGFCILVMQFVISARIKWIEKPFGLDQIFRFHKTMAVVAALLLISHPVLLAASHNTWILFTSFQMPPVIILGRLTLYLLLILAVVSIFRKALHLGYNRWLGLHNIAAVIILGMGSYHSYHFSADLEKPTTRIIMAVVLLMGIIAYIKHTFVDPVIARRNTHKIINVKQETPNIWTLEMAPAEGGNIPDYLPGQFHFLKLYRKNSRKTEEHPFTISSSPTQKGYLTSTIKASGNYTSTIDTTIPGDTAVIQGPFGRFSHVLYPDERDLIFISGGIGITPLISMLRYMRDTKSDVNVRMLYFCRTVNDIAFRDELAEIEMSGVPKLNLTYVLSFPDAAWQGEKGHPDKDMLKHLLGDGIASKAYYICGPPAMMKAVIKALRELGIHESKIRYENFAL